MKYMPAMACEAWSAGIRASDAATQWLGDGSFTLPWTMLCESLNAETRAAGIDLFEIFCHALYSRCVVLRSGRDLAHQEAKRPILRYPSLVKPLLHPAKLAA